MDIHSRQRRVIPSLSRPDCLNPFTQETKGPSWQRTESIFNFARSLNPHVAGYLWRRKKKINNALDDLRLSKEGKEVCNWHVLCDKNLVF